MASHWGNSWGTNWAHSWDVVATPPPAVVTMGGASHPSRKYLAEVWRAYHAEKAAAAKLHKKKKKVVLAALEEVAETIAAVESSQGILAFLAPLQELTVTLDTKQIDLTARLAEIKAATDILKQMLEEDEDDIMLMIWAIH